MKSGYFCNYQVKIDRYFQILIQVSHVLNFRCSLLGERQSRAIRRYCFPWLLKKLKDNSFANESKAKLV